MLGIMDVFPFPSLYEGLPLVYIESQAAGLPSVISDAIPLEADVVKPLVRRLSLSQPPEIWADTILAHNKRLTKDSSLQIMEGTTFNIEQSTKDLMSLYSHSVPI